MSTAAYAWGEIELDAPRESFENLDKEFTAFLETKPKSFESDCIYELNAYGDTVVLAISCDGQLGSTEWLEADCWLKFIVEDFLKPRNIKVTTGDFWFEGDENAISKLFVTKGYVVKWQESELKWKRPFTTPYKFADEMRAYLSK